MTITNKGKYHNIKDNYKRKAIRWLRDINWGGTKYNSTKLY